MVMHMTPATSVTFIKPEFGDFLYASIGGGAEAVPTTVMSALARLDLDPWQEASELTELSSAAATVRLSNLLAKLPQSQRSLVNSRSYLAIFRPLSRVHPSRALRFRHY